ncbi:putative dTDP-glucose 4; 6-dehydratase [Paratrimastix pyriformis]|uniref:dTDP-glucose 4 n=1 Tax=Paratrimastix pyriformis TaxID=342808 RepID=A0ABQ8UV16_9EUKA|nr:putative dTDP-glucose 4; 6-dehydratase [Paratrimastix pyriformis]
MPEDPKQTRVLVTGGYGFIGSHFVRWLLTHHPDYFVVNMDKLSYAADPEYLADIMSTPAYRARYCFVEGDICDIQACRRALFATDTPSAEPVEMIFNFAAESHVDRGLCAPLVFAQNNTIGTLTLLEACRENPTVMKRLRRFVHISTDEVYGSSSCESSAQEVAVFREATTVLEPRNPYSASKAAAEMFLSAYHKTFGLPIVITRSSNNYGPCQHPEKFVPVCILNALQGKQIPIFGSGLQMRDWIFVEDNCEAIDIVSQLGVLGHRYNICSGRELTNLDMAKGITQVLGLDESHLVHVADRLGHDFRYSMDNSQTRGLGWQCRTTLQEGLRRTIEWYRARYLQKGSTPAPSPVPSEGQSCPLVCEETLASGGAH